MELRLAFLVAGCFFMEMLDGTIVTTAAPAISRDLGVAPSSVGLIVTSYLVALAIFIPTGGWLLTRLSARTVFVSAITIFTLASLGCGFAPTLGALTAFRVLQGIGGALMVPVGRQVVFANAPKDQVLRLMSFIIWPGLLAPVVAPLLGAVITGHASWQWIFWINVPLGVIAAAAAARIVPARGYGDRLQFDWPGFVLVGVGLGGLTWTAHLIADSAGSVMAILLWLCGSLIACAAAARHLHVSASPLLSIRVMHDRIFGFSQASGTVFFMMVAAVPFLLPLMMQIAFGWSATTAGVLVMFVFAGNIGIKPLTNPILRAFGFRPVLIGATVGMSATVVALGLCTAHTEQAVIALLALLSGVFRSIALTAFSTVGFATISTAQRAAANTVQAVAQQLGTGLGVAAATIALSAGHAITGADGHAAYAWAFGLVAALGVIPVALCLRLPDDTGHQLRPAPRRRPRQPA